MNLTHPAFCCLLVVSCRRLARGAAAASGPIRIDFLFC